MSVMRKTRRDSPAPAVVVRACDLPVEPDDGVGRVGPDLVAEQSSVGLELAQRIGPSAGVGERPHEERTRTVTKRLTVDQWLNGRDRRRPRIFLEQQLGEIFDCAGPELGEPRRLGAGPGLVRELAVGGAPPEPSAPSSAARVTAASDGRPGRFEELPRTAVHRRCRIGARSQAAR